MSRRARTHTLPVTRDNPIPESVVIDEGAGVALASRRVAKNLFHMLVFRIFGNRACWPRANGRWWIIDINPPASEEWNDET